MASSQAILEYEPPPLSITARLARLLVALGREVVRRKPWPAELLLLAWLTLSVANAVQGVRCRNLHIVYTPPIFVWPWAFLALTVTLAGFYGLARPRRY